VLCHHSLREIERLSTGEFNLYLDAVEYAQMQEMEKIRLLMYPTFAVNSKKKLKLTDVMSFDWDNPTKAIMRDEVGNEQLIINREERKQLLERMKNIEKRLNQNV
jgi:hypothetical protein